MGMYGRVWVYYRRLMQYGAWQQAITVNARGAAVTHGYDGTRRGR